MCDYCQYLDLVETNRYRINFCKRCKAFTLTYQSCCAVFTQLELEKFHIALRVLTPSHYQHDFLGKRMAVIKKPEAPIGFCLSQDDTKELARAVAESLTHYDAYCATRRASRFLI